MNGEDFCPACNKVLPFEECDGTLVCSSCGRTKAAARMALEPDTYGRRKKTIARWKKRGKWFACALTILYLIIFFNAPSGRGGGTVGGRAVASLVSWTVIGGLIALLWVLGLGLRWIVVRLWRSDEGK